MPEYRVLIAEPIAREGIERLNQEPNIHVTVLEPEKTGNLSDVIGDFHALVVRSKTKVDRSLLQAATNLRIVGRAGTGVDNIDLDAATEMGVVVVNAPGGNSVSVAELTMGLMLACSRKIPLADRLMKQGEWAKPRLKGRELTGKTLGVVGFGRIGREVAARASAMGMRIMVFDPYLSAKALEGTNFELSTLEDLLGASHFVTLHMPLNDETRGMIGPREIDMMRDQAVLINAARGGLVDERALLRALDSGKLAGAGLDAFEGEPEPMRKLVEHEAVVATPHIGASTAEAQENVGYKVACEVAGFLTSGSVESAVNYSNLSKEEAIALAPYLPLAQRLGELAAAVSKAPAERLEVEYSGMLCNVKHEVLTDRVLCGMLGSVSAQGPINPINARSFARSRSLEVSERLVACSTSARSDSTIIVRLTGKAGTVQAGGTVSADKRPPRLVMLNGLDLDFPLEGRLLVVENKDTPGVVGRLGGYLGEIGVNIVNLSLKRKQREGEALAVVQLDRKLSRKEVDVLSGLDGIERVWAVRLGR